MENNPRFPNANPPGHTLALALTIFLTCLSTVPNILSSIDNVATLDTCTTPLFPNLMSTSTLGYIRLSFSLFVLAVSIYAMTQKQIVTVTYMKGSKLRSVPLTIQGMKAQAYFTSWAWNVLGLSFAVSGLLTLYVDKLQHNLLQQQQEEETIITMNNSSQELLLLSLSSSSQPYLKIAFRTSLILFEIAAPASMLVSAVVRYVLWPKAMKGHGNTAGLRRGYILLQHNVNIIFSIVEVGLLGGIKVRFTDMALAPLFGLTYVFFAWSVKHIWLENGEPQFLYFFLDTTLPGKGTSIALFALGATLCLFYAIFVLVDDFIDMLGGGFGIHLVVVIGIASLMCRFRD